MADLTHVRVEWDADLAIVTIDRQDKLNALNGEVVAEIGDVFSGLREFPVRVKCATLAWHALRAALQDNDESAKTE